MGGFSDVMRSLDGMQFAYANGPRKCDPHVGRVSAGRVGMGENTGSLMWRLLARHLGSSKAEWRVFGIYYNDDREVVKTDNRPTAVRNADLSAINIGT